MIFLFDTLKNCIVSINIEKKYITIYTCGPTVYRKVHFGNMRPYIYYSILVKILKLYGLKIKWVMNITDIGDEDLYGNDKIIQASLDEKIEVHHLVNKYTNYFLDIYNNLNLEKPDLLVKASQYINTMHSIINIMQNNGYLYHNNLGIYINVDKVLLNKSYKLLHTNNNIYHNFAVWRYMDNKISVPGWHIECLAIIKDEIGFPVDIHCGGVDHICIHHNNEIIQKIAYDHCDHLANVWIHVGMVNIDNNKMSKRYNNSIYIEDLINQGFRYDDIILFNVMSYYRSDIIFSYNILKQSHNTLNNIIVNFAKMLSNLDDDSIIIIMNRINNNIPDINSPYMKYLYNDIDTNGFIMSILSDLKSLDVDLVVNSMICLKYITNINVMLYIYLYQYVDEINMRNYYRYNNKWNEADKIRDFIVNNGFIIIDGYMRSVLIKL